MADITAELGAAYDAAQGSSEPGMPVIDTGGSIKPDDRPKPGAEPTWQTDLDEHRARKSETEEALARAWDRAQARQGPPQDLPEPEGITRDERYSRAWEWSQSSPAEKRVISEWSDNLQGMLDAAKRANLDVMSSDGKTIDAAKLQALKSLMGLDKAKTEARPEDAPPSETLKQLAPHAKTQTEAEQAVRPYADFERAYAERGPDAFIDAARQRGHQLYDVSNPQHSARVAAAYYGVPFDQVARELHYVPAEQVQDLIERHAATTVLDDWSRGKPDYDQIRFDMAKFIQSPAFREREGESQSQMLERVYARVRRDRARQGPKTAMQRGIEAAADKVYAS